MCPYALGRQSLRDSGQINGMFDRTVDKAVNLIDSEMTAVKEQTEDLVTVIVAGVGQGPMSFKRQARYLVLHPGQTIYMPLGTIHHVFRKQSDPTLITGGFGRVAPCYFELNTLDDTGLYRPSMAGCT